MKDSKRHGYEEEEELNEEAVTRRLSSLLDDDRATEPDAKRQKIDVCAHHGGRLRYTLSRMFRKLVGRPVHPTFWMMMMNGSYQCDLNLASAD